MPHAPRSALVRLVLAGLLGLLVAPAVAVAEPPSLRNGAFEAWKDGLPVGWEASTGARRDPGDVPSRIEPLEGGGVALVGDAKTNLWRMLGQRVQARPGTFLELRYRARAVGSRREAGQFGSCYVGFILRNVQGKPAGFQIADVRHTAWREGAVRLKLPRGVSTVDVAIFLSQTGRLEVTSLALHERGPADAFDVLVEEMDRHYSFFHAHEIDWRARAQPHGEAARAAKTPAAFIDRIKPLLAQLEDGHVWIEAPDGTKTWTYTPRPHLNFELQTLMGRLEHMKQVTRNVLSATTAEGYGYLALGTMQLEPEQFLAVEQAFRGHFDKPGIILDLRVNTGGQEVWGQRLCAYLTKTRVHYASALTRSGPKHDDLAPSGERHVVPAKAGHYGGPVVALIGPGCVSSGEGMAMMLKALPDVPLVGLPTRGSSGNPQPVHLPNGVSVWFSRWISLLPDGTSIERKGVPPDVRVEHLAGKDAALEEAVKILNSRVRKR